MHVPCNETSAAASKNRWFRPTFSEFVVYDDERVGIKYLVRTAVETVYYGKKGYMKKKGGKGKGW